MIEYIKYMKKYLIFIVKPCNISLDPPALLVSQVEHLQSGSVKFYLNILSIFLNKILIPVVKLRGLTPQT